MSWNYARTEIDKALKAAKGNPLVAGRAIIAAATTDHRLLLELATPHLKGIVAHAVGRVVNAKTSEPEDHPDTPEGIDMPLDAFGRELLGALSGRNTPRFGYEDAAPPTGHKAASKAHIETMKRIAKKPN